MLILAADKAVDRLEAVIYLLPSLDKRIWPLSRTDLQYGWISLFQAVHRNFVYPDMKALLNAYRNIK